MILAKLPVFLSALLLVACVGGQTVPEPESPGALLFKDRCTQCHGLPSPKRHTPEQWAQLLGMMEGFMQQKDIEFPSEEKKNDSRLFI